MNIVMLNSCNYGSTGNIMLGIAQMARKNGHCVYTACPEGRSMRMRKLENHIYIGTRLGRNIHILLRRLTGFHGMFSVIDTWVFLKRLDRIKPDIIHLHNLHDSYINLPLLFGYIKRNHTRTIWTLHDCWAFTGQCPYFTMARCEKWRTGCHCCTQLDIYPSSKIDRTKRMWKLKKKWFSGVSDMTVVAPSQWLAGMAKESFLKSYPIKVIHNGIDLRTFNPNVRPSPRWQIDDEGKAVLLGVAFDWGRRKGLDVFIELAKRLGSRFQIVLVGTDEETDKLLPRNIISIHKTQNQRELAQLYASADIFVNPTREEVFGLVNAEALACGTPVITFDTGGSPEIPDETCGSIVDCDDIDALEREIIRVWKNIPYSESACIARAKQFDMERKYQEYLDLYEGISRC